MPYKKLSLATAILLLTQGAASPLLAAAVEEIEVVGISPGAVAQQALRKVPYRVQSSSFEDLDASQSLDLSEHLNGRFSSVSLNAAQNNPLQSDLQFRGFTASPLLGLPQGLAVYQNGVRINEPLGDAVNWDLLPESAVHGVELLSGSNPVFGLNTLGGALSLRMKDGFLFQGSQLEGSTGSWGRRTLGAESGGNDGRWGYYVNLNHFEEDGWRDLSPSEARNFYATLSWRDAQRSAVDLTYQQGRSELVGNGALPVGLLAQRRAAIFTAPDITENDLRMVDLSARHELNDRLNFSGNVFWRENLTDSFNGDGSEFELCEFAGGARALFEEADDVENSLEDSLGIELDAICAGEDDSITHLGALEMLIAQRAELAGLDAEDFELEDVFGDLSGSGVLSDEAINNISRRKQTSKGVNGQLQFDGGLFARPNQFIAGYSWLRGTSTFEAKLELADLDPVTRSTQGLGTGTFVNSAATDINTETETWGLYFSNTIDLDPTLALTLSGRYNSSEITLRDRSGARPELNGDHKFSRFNPAIGLTWTPVATRTVYASYSESNRVPTPIELACNEGVFELARRYAEAAGEDPDDIDFECRLPNAFLADPPLDDVVTRTLELGLRGEAAGLRYDVGLFRADNRDDILFQTTGRATGLFANVDKTRRQGVELAVAGNVAALDWYATYTWLEATFEDDFRVLSPNHPDADGEGRLQVSGGNRIPGLPESIVKLGGDYRLGSALRIGAELIYNADQVLRGDEANTLDTVDSYTLVNLRAQYRLGTNVLLFARVTNLFDTDYESFGLLGENPGEVLPQLTDDRPLFLGAGAPRAAWVGLRLRF